MDLLLFFNASIKTKTAVQRGFPVKLRFSTGGENRIRTCEAVTPTRFPVVRLKPNSAISPKLRNVEYYTRKQQKKQAFSERFSKYFFFHISGAKQTGNILFLRSRQPGSSSAAADNAITATNPIPLPVSSRENTVLFRRFILPRFHIRVGNAGRRIAATPQNEFHRPTSDRSDTTSSAQTPSFAAVYDRRFVLSREFP